MRMPTLTTTLLLLQLGCMFPTLTALSLKRFKREIIYGPWTDWTPCSTTCGDKGIRSRTRQCTDTDEGPDAKLCRQVGGCNRFKCPDEEKYHWTDWKPCSKPCGRGSRRRYDTTGSFQLIPCRGQSCTISEDCQNLKADITFVLDSSASLTYLNWFIFKQFAVDVVHSLPIPDKTKVRYAAISYATSIRSDFDFDFSYDRDGVENAIWGLPPLAGATNVADALRTVTKLFREKGRKDASHIAIFLIDATSNVEPASVPNLAQQAHNQGIHIYGVAAVTSSLSQAFQLVNKRDNLFYISGYHNLIKKVQPAVDALCETAASERIECSDFSEWSECSVPCGPGGVKERSRTCTHYNTNGAVVTSLTDTDTQDCELIECDECRTCTLSGEIGFMVNQLDCTKYYMCQRIGPNKYLKFLFGCAKGTYFNTLKGICARSHSGDCRELEEQTISTTVRTTTTTTEQTAASCPYRAVSGDPAAYQVHIYASYWVTMRCGDILVFDFVKCTCIYPPPDSGSDESDEGCGETQLHFTFEKDFMSGGCLRSPATPISVDRPNVQSASGSHSALFDKNNGSHMIVSVMNNWFNEKEIDEFTISVWVRLSSVPAEGIMGIVHNGDCSPTPSIAIYVINGTLVGALAVGAGEPEAEYLYTQTPVQTNTWMHIAYVYDGASLTLYLDGYDVGSKLITGFIATRKCPVLFGHGGKENNNGYLDGYLDEVKFVTQAWTPADIQTEIADNNPTG